MFGSLKKNISNYVLQKQGKHLVRSKELKTLENSSTAGILFKLTNNSSDFDTYLEFMHYLTSRNIRVFAIAYYEGKNIPAMYLNSKEINLLSFHNINWHFKPTAPFIKAFIETEYDLLLDLSTEECLPLEHISQLSRAKFKVGINNSSKNFTDLMIDVKDNTSPTYFIEQIKHFLTILK